MLASLETQTLVVFTTAYDRTRSITCSSQSSLNGGPRPDVSGLLTLLGDALRGNSAWMERVASRTGEKVEPVEPARVTHFFASDKLTFAATPERNYVVSQTIAELETKLNPARFIGIRRGAILSLDHVWELHTDFGGRMVVRLKKPDYKSSDYVPALMSSTKIIAWVARSNGTIAVTM